MLPQYVRLVSSTTQSPNLWTNTISCPKRCSYLQQGSHEFDVRTGFLSAGHDLFQGTIPVVEAEERCVQMPECRGFTFQHGISPSQLATTNGTLSINDAQSYRIFFKSAAAEFHPHEDWFTWSRKQRSEVVAMASMPRDGTVEEVDDTRDDELSLAKQTNDGDGAYRVDIYRQDPLVVVVHNFTNAIECQAMMDEAKPKLSPAQVPK